MTIFLKLFCRSYFANFLFVWKVFPPIKHISFLQLCWFVRMFLKTFIPAIDFRDLLTLRSVQQDGLGKTLVILIFQFNVLYISMTSSLISSTFGISKNTYIFKWCSKNKIKNEERLRRKMYTYQDDTRV